MCSMRVRRKCKIMKTIVITGGSSGIGKATASLFAERGWRVFELSRHGAIYCDVCDDVVISNAGYGISGPIEYTKIADAEHQMDVNFMGAVRFTQAILPQLRQQGYGRIIYTSSVAAQLPVPYQAFYSASKAAINAMALALANEVKDFGISVSVMMPGDVSTGFTDARNKSTAGEEIYRSAHKAITNMERDERAGMQPEQMARLFYHIATCHSPRPQYVGGFLYRVLCFLDRILPKRFVNWIEYKLYS